MTTFYCNYFFAWHSGPLTLGGPLDFAYPAYPIVTPLFVDRCSVVSYRIEYPTQASAPVSASAWLLNQYTEKTIYY